MSMSRGTLTVLEMALVHIGLEGSLHGQVIPGRDAGNVHEGWRQAVTTARDAPLPAGIVLDVELLGAAARIQDRAPIARGEDRLDTIGDSVCEQADGARRRNRRQVAVADAVAADLLSQLRGQRTYEGSLHVAIRIEEGETTLLAGDGHRRTIGAVAYRTHGVGRDGARPLAVVTKTQHQAEHRRDR